MLTVFLSLVLANSIKLSEIAIIGSASFLLIFFIVNLGAYRLRKEINAGRTILLTACLVSGAALTTLLVHTFSHSPVAISVFLSFIGISFLFETVYGRLVRKHMFRRPYHKT